MARPHVLAAAAMLALAGWAASPSVHAQGSAEGTSRPATPARSLRIDLPSQSLSRSIDALARQFGVGIGLDATLVQGHAAPAVRGDYTLSQALGQALAGSGLRAVPSGGGMVVVRDGASLTLGAITVTAAAPTADELPEAYAGGQVARGGRVGLLGNRDFMETPFNTTSYTEQFVKDRQAQDIGSVIGATDPSVYVSGSTGMINDGFSLRGFAVAASDVAFGGLYGVIPYWRVTPELAERIEVLKGPSALLNGMPPGGSVGGSINLVPKRAGDEPLTRITGTYASDAQFGTHVDVGRRFGENKQLGIRFNGVYRDGDSAVDHQSKKATLAALGIDWRSDRARLSADLYTSEDRVDGLNRGISLASGLAVPTPPKAETLLSPDWTYTDTQDRAVVLRGELDVTRDITAYAAYGHSATDFDSVAGATYEVFNANGDYRNNFSHQRIRMDKNTAEAGVRGRFETGEIRHEVAATASYYQHDYHFGFVRNMLASNWVTNIDDPVWGSPVDNSFSSAALPRTAALRTTSYGLADTLSFAQDRVQLTLGLRRQNVVSDTFDSATGSRTARYDAGATTPAAAVLFKATDWMSLYGNSIQGLSQGATAPTTAVNAGEVFAPYKTQQQEVGAKFDLGSFATTVSAFQIRRPSAYTDPVTNVYSFGGEQRNRGLEFGFFGELARGVRLMGGISYTEAKLTRTAGGVNQGRYATAMPRWQGKLGTEWDIPGVQGLTASANMVAMSKQYISADNSLWVAGRTVYDLGARYATTVANRPVTLRANVSNVFNKAYWAGSLGSGLGAPRTFLLSASVDL
ncbi:iron complex outermembrane receptor protein [Comamonas sp. BIGb0124]|uniref:TonB-dependent receptor n=1 Tax=Comamonas sp. BIGb0124 TaxID=2485130 RepID=UPI000FA497F4|nr:TonB-dependent receptor [Comamonas sp. BIGb0124]ROR16993.1 iron complex outermembrane receptor protein [Comamonas sp. BIGb0124]